MNENGIGNTSLVRVLVIAVFAAVAGHAASAVAQSCSPAEEELRAQYYQASVNALKSENLELYANLQQSLPERLSPSCRQVLNQAEPMRMLCSSQEKSLILQHYQAAIRAAWNGDLTSVFAYMENLEASISPQCWVASNRNSDPRVQRSCTSQELDHVASFAGPLLRETKRMLNTLDPTWILQLTQQIYGPLSQRCANMLMQVQQEAQGEQNQAMQQVPGSVLDHGGGTYSVPGLGACTPSECMMY